MERYSKTDKIGTGAYGVVYKAYDTLSRKHVALKKIRLEVEDEGIPASALREFSYLKMLQLIRHPNIVFLENVTFSSNRLYLAFELMEGDLKRLMDTYPNRFDADLVQSYTSQIFDGLAYMHSLGVMHRDLKPQNLLVSRDGCIKIADFGLARSALPKKRALSIEVITRWYRPPEILLGGDVYSSAVDVWSVGCIIAEMSNMRPLFPSDSEIDQIHRIFRLLGTPSDEVWPQFSSMPLYRNSYPNWQKIHLSIVVPRLSTDAVNLLEVAVLYIASYTPDSCHSVYFSMTRLLASVRKMHFLIRMPVQLMDALTLALSSLQPTHLLPPNSRTRTSAVSNTEGSTSSADSSGGSCAPGTSSSFSSSRRPPVVPIVNPRPHVRSVLPSNGTENDGSGKEEPHSTEESHEDHVKADDSQNDDSAQCGVEAEESLTDDRRPCQSTSAASKKRTRRK